MRQAKAGSTLSVDERRQVPTYVHDRKGTSFKMRGARNRVKAELRKVLYAIDDLDIDYEEDAFLDL